MVVGTAFGNLENLLEMFKTVFVINDTSPAIKARNLVYRSNFGNLVMYTDITAIFVDLSHIDSLQTLSDIWQRNKSVVIIEGNDAIGREFSKSLYHTGWQCTSLQGTYHIWEKI
jgi:hypothetical protein